MKSTLLFSLLAVSLIILSNIGYAQDVCTTGIPCGDQNLTIQPINKTSIVEEKICIYFFYGLSCPNCANIEPLIKELSEKYSEIEIKSFEVYFNNENQNLFNDFNRRYDIKLTGVPAIFIGDRAFIGEKAIKENLEKSINYFIENTPVCPEKYNKVEAKPHEISPTKKIELTLPVLISAALIDSINPCAFSVLIFLLVYLMALGAKKRILKVGFAYITTVFIVYFLSGFGLFVIIQKTELTRVFYTISAVIAIIAGLISVKDFFWYGKGITLAIPKSQEPLLQKYIHKATMPAAIVLGILVSMFELPCTGGVYLAILGLLSSKMTLFSGIPYLFLYNVIFVLPLVIILLIVYLGVPPEKAEQWRLEKRAWMRLIMGLVMIALGAIMLLELI